MPGAPLLGLLLLLVCQWQLGVVTVLGSGQQSSQDRAQHVPAVHAQECYQAPEAPLGRKVAVLVSGHLHYLGLTAENLRTNIVAAVGGDIGAAVDVFVYGASESTDPTERLQGEAARAQLERLVQLLHPVAVELRPQVPLEDVAGYAIEAGTNTERAVVRNLQQLYGMYEVNRMRKERERLYGFRYDWIVRARADMLLARPIPSLDQVPVDRIILPASKTGWPRSCVPCASDRFAMGPAHLMDLYMSQYARADRSIVQRDFPMFYMWHYLDALSRDCDRDIVHLSANVQLLRVRSDPADLDWSTKHGPEDGRAKMADWWATRPARVRFQPGEFVDVDQLEAVEVDGILANSTDPTEIVMNRSALALHAHRNLRALRTLFARAGDDWTESLLDSLCPLHLDAPRARLPGGAAVPIHHNSTSLACLEHWSVLGLATGTAPRHASQLARSTGTSAHEQLRTAQVAVRGSDGSEEAAAPVWIYRLEQHVAESIARAAAVEKPFPHGFVENLFPANVYQQLLRHISDIDAWEDFRCVRVCVCACVRVCVFYRAREFKADTKLPSHPSLTQALRLCTRRRELFAHSHSPPRSGHPGLPARFLSPRLLGPYASVAPEVGRG